MKILAALVLCCCLAFSPVACTRATTANIPGSVNNADAQIYVALSDLQTAIIAAQGQQASHPSLKPLLDNQIGPNYDRARIAAQAYHDALANGSPADASKQAAILQQVSAIKTALQAALKQAGVQ